MSDYTLLNEALQLGGVLTRVVDTETGEIVTACPCSPAREEEEQGRGLSISNKVLRVRDNFQVYNKKTGETIVLNKADVRVSRLRKRVYTWANSVKEVLQNKEKYRVVMMTLTYRNGRDWRPNQIRNFMLAMRACLKSKLVSYAWVAELQERGAVHYHVLLAVKKGARIPYPDDAGLWPWGMSRTETAKSVFYIVKYTGKEYQKYGLFPKGMRMFAVWIAPKLISQVEKWVFRLSAIPAWLKEEILKLPDLVGEKWKRRKGGGWLFGGREFQSPFEYLGAY